MKETGSLTLNKRDRITASDVSGKTLHLLFNDKIASKLEVTIDGTTHLAADYDSNYNSAVRLVGGSSYAATYIDSNPIQVVYWLISSSLCPSTHPAYTTVSHQNSTFYVTPIVLNPPNVSQFDSFCVFSLAQDKAVATFHHEGNVNGTLWMYIGDTKSGVIVNNSTKYNIGLSALFVYDGFGKKVGTFSMKTSAVDCSTFVNADTRNSHVFVYTKDSANRIISDRTQIKQTMQSSCSSSSSSKNGAGVLFAIVFVVVVIIGAAIGGYFWWRKRNEIKYLNNTTDSLLEQKLI